MALFLIFISGLAALIYQVLWMKQLGLLFGNTSYSAGVTLAAFFGGLALGSWLWGRRSTTMRLPLRHYAYLEIGIAVTACIYFFLLTGYHAFFPYVYQHVDSPALLLAIKVALALVLILPPTVFMGGTIPVMAQHLLHSDEAKSRFGTTAAMLYAVNTLGAASGALLAGFFLPPVLGFRLTYALAIALSAGSAILAWLISQGVNAIEPATAQETEPPPTNETKQAATNASDEHLAHRFKRLGLSAICFISGFGFLSLEVLWTRMFMQVLENSVYTFATIVVIVLLSLAVGAFISSQLSRLKISPPYLLAGLLVLSGFVIAATPFFYMRATNGMQVLATNATWAGYLWQVLKVGVVTVGPAAVTMGTIFPYLMKTEETYVDSAGQSLGRLAAINTAGAILGALLCSFVFLYLWGMWVTTLVLAIVYLLAVLAVPLPWRGAGVTLRLSSGLVWLIVLTWLNPTGLPIISADPMRPYEEIVLKAWETSEGTVAVTESSRGRMIRVNSHYGLGSTLAAPHERMQTDLTLKLFPETRRIFYLGMGTGITAGSALHPSFKNVENIVVCEIVPKVIDAADEFFTDVNGVDYTQGLFKDDRATILAEDGRHFLTMTDQRFDIINCDLFVPFRAGVGSLYTEEHYENIKARLEPGGICVQWLPLYQLTEHEFKVIVRTMMSVFDQVSLWRDAFQPGQDVVGLIGQTTRQPLPATNVDSRADMRLAIQGRTVRDAMTFGFPFNEQTALFFYCGNVTENADLFADVPINTDDYPIIEYQAPRSYRRNANAESPWFTDKRIIALIETMQQNCPPSQDPLLANRSQADRVLPIAGTHFYKIRVALMDRDYDEARAQWLRFVEAWNGTPIQAP